MEEYGALMFPFFHRECFVVCLLPSWPVFIIRFPPRVMLEADGGPREPWDKYLMRAAISSPRCGGGQLLQQEGTAAMSFHPLTQADVSLGFSRGSRATSQPGQAAVQGPGATGAVPGEEGSKAQRDWESLLQEHLLADHS